MSALQNPCTRPIEQPCCQRSCGGSVRMGFPLPQILETLPPLPGPPDLATHCGRSFRLCEPVASWTPSAPRRGACRRWEPLGLGGARGGAWDLHPGPAGSWAFHSCPALPPQSLFEVVTSEASYLRSLRLLTDTFVLSQALRDTLTPRDHHTLFSNVQRVQGVSERSVGSPPLSKSGLGGKALLSFLPVPWPPFQGSGSA